MTLFEAIQARRSVRAYLPKPVEAEKFEAVLLAASQAPSAGNLQAYQIFVVRDPALKKSLVRPALGQEFLAQAPVVLVFCTAPQRSAKYGERGTHLYSLQDASIAVAYAQLAATAQGLATCWVGAFNEDAVAGALGLPGGLRPVALLPLGYPAEEPRRTSRRALRELVEELAGPA